MIGLGMNEIQHLIYEKQKQEKPVSNQTILKYQQQYNYLTKNIGFNNPMWITESNEKSLIKAIEELDVSPSGKLNYLNVCIMIKKMYDKPLKQLEKYRDTLFTDKSKLTDEKIIVKKNTLPSYKTITDFINDLYKQGDYTRYLVNELIFTFGLRNKDIDVMIIELDNYKELKKNNPTLESENNFLVLKKSSTELIINQYKTRATYGTKKIPIRSRRILQASMKLGEGYLLQNAKGEQPSNYDYYLKLYDLQGEKLGEADYYKIHINHLQSQPNSLQEINKLCKYRGSSLAVCNTHYNINKE